MRKYFLLLHGIEPHDLQSVMIVLCTSTVERINSRRKLDPAYPSTTSSQQRLHIGCNIHHRTSQISQIHDTTLLIDRREAARTEVRREGLILDLT